MKPTRLKIKGLKFDEETHIYTYRGVEQPSVTTIIGEWITIKIRGVKYMINVFTGLMILKSVMEKAADTGIALHRGCEILAHGKDLNWGKLSEDLIKPLENFRHWMDEFDFQPRLIEQLIYNETYGYAGTLDLFGKLMGSDYLVDIKTGPPSWTVGMQTAAYLEPLLMLPLGKVDKKVKRGVLYLPKKGGKCKLKIIKTTEPVDFQAFKNILRFRQYQKEHGK